MEVNQEEKYFIVSHVGLNYNVSEGYDTPAEARENKKGREFIVKGLDSDLKDYTDAIKKKSKMVSQEWDWSKLPENKYNHAIELFENQSISKMIQLHDVFKLSINEYCCGPIDAIIMRQYRHAIQNNLIYRIDEK